MFKYFRLLVPLPVLAITAIPVAAMEPLYVKNLSPVAGLFGLPSQRSALTQGRGSVAAALHSSVANNYVVDSSNQEYVKLDGETLRFAAELRYGLARNWDLQLEVPWLEQSGGHMDRVIDEWHDLWGMSDGGRSEVPRDQLEYRYASASGRSFLLEDDSSGLGDISLALTYAVFQEEDAAVSVAVGYKFGTGDEDDFLGSGGDDFFTLVRFSGGHLSDLPLRWHGQLGYLHAGDSDLLAGMQEQDLWFAGLSLDWLVSERWSILAQLDGNAAPTDSGLTPLGDDTLIFTGGVRWRITPRWAVDVSIMEDILVDTASDVTFQASLRFRGN